jgi:lipopolysaccharide/colanic/teichoic acid biosynthesis glycosyltransferase
MNHSQSIGKNILPKQNFLDRLREEKRRADRSKTALSVAIFHLQEEGISGKNPIEELLNLLQRNTRETDIKGWIDQNKIGLILPDTNGAGVNRFVEKIEHGNGKLHYSVITGTYPDLLFKEILKEEHPQAELYPINIDDSGKRPDRLQRALKRGMDVIGSIIGILVFSPVMVLAVLAVKLNSPGPAVFKQSRLGMKGIKFLFYKFRSMYWNVDDQIHREYVNYLIKGDLEKIDQGDGKEPLYKMKSDTRITWVGKIIRKTSIDELPQFLNVLKGEMSLVGPRPPLPYEVEKYEPWHLRRILEVKPGITGLWQVTGRSITSFDEMVRLDLRYAQHWSIWLDLKILLKTVRAVVRPKGAL